MDKLTDPLKVGFGCGKRVDGALTALIGAVQDCYLSDNPTESSRAYKRLIVAFGRVLRNLPFYKAFIGRARFLFWDYPRGKDVWINLIGK